MICFSISTFTRKQRLKIFGSCHDSETLTRQSNSAVVVLRWRRTFQRGVAAALLEQLGNRASGDEASSVSEEKCHAIGMYAGSRGGGQSRPGPAQSRVAAHPHTTM